jgi:tetratricopeptide (TPR) repeat protein
MSRKNALYALISFALGATTVLVAKTPKIIFDPKAYYAGAERKAAAAALLAQGEKLAKDDSWERIGVGRVAYLSGDKQKGEAIFQSILSSPKVAKSDIYRIAWAYAASQEWSKAKPLFEKAVAMDKDDDTQMLKVGCWFNVNGDRARAEELFNAAFAHSPEETWHYILAAGSYEGVEPF